MSEQFLGEYNNVPPTLTNGGKYLIQLDANGNQKVGLATAVPTGINHIGSVSLDPCSNVIGKVSIDQTIPEVTNAVTLTGSNVQLILNLLNSINMNLNQLVHNTNPK